MKTYTFKIKLQFPKEKHPVILSVVHCPLEVLFDSLKEVKEFNELYNKLNEPTNTDIPLMYITASDYLISDDKYISNDFILANYKAVIESNSLKEFLCHSSYFGFVEEDSTVKSESDLLKELMNYEQREKNEV